jgi:translation initiation factor IF-1
MKRNTQGGKAFKRGPKGGKDQFRAASALAAANELLELIQARDKVGLDKLSAEDKAALCELQVGRVIRKLGNGRMEVYCQDGTIRNCAIRKLLRRKGACYIDIDNLVAVALSVPLDELEESDDEGHYGGGAQAAGSKNDQGFIAGLFDVDTTSRLRKTQINPVVFGDKDDLETLFDRSAGGASEMPVVEAEKKGRKGRAAGSDEVRLEDL